MNIKITKRIYKEIDDFPETLFKYRDWNEPNHKTILTEQIVFMAPPASFEDPMDCKSMKRYDLMTNKDIYAKYYDMSKKDRPNWNEKQHSEFAENWFDKSPMRNKEYLKQLSKEDYHRFNERFGVLSLTENAKLYEMWVKYSNNHKGFCVGFHPKILFEFLGGGGSVTYLDKLPIIEHNDDHHIEHFKRVMCKEKKWEFEQEYRTFIFRHQPIDINDRKISLPKECYSKIIFGAKMTTENKNNIIDTCNKLSLKVEYFESNLIENAIKLKKL